MGPELGDCYVHLSSVHLNQCQSVRRHGRVPGFEQACSGTRVAAPRRVIRAVGDREPGHPLRARVLQPIIPAIVAPPAAPVAGSAIAGRRGRQRGARLPRPETHLIGLTGCLPRCGWTATITTGERQSSEVRYRSVSRSVDTRCVVCPSTALPTTSSAAYGERGVTAGPHGARKPQRSGGTSAVSGRACRGRRRG
jgi:hypothetical protein